MKFTNALIGWYSKNKRSLPWRNDPSPYLVWLSEIILQQTRVEQGLPYYEKFRETFPTVQSLANAQEKEVLKLWQGLGYYSRARNLHTAAKQVTETYNGTFPDNYEELLQLKGVGPYSAAAIASICYDEPVAVVDGNVFRFLSRYFAISTPMDSTSGKKEFMEVATSLLDHQHPGTFNQAMMEFGATVCTPKNSFCSECVFRTSCMAFLSGTVHNFPVKEKKVRKENLHLHYFVIRVNGGIFLQQRPPNGIWGNMYDFPSRSSSKTILQKHLETKARELNLPVLKKAEKSAPVKHLLTHRKITARFWLFEVPDYSPAESLIFVADVGELQKFAVPKIVERYLAERIFSETNKIVI